MVNLHHKRSVLHGQRIDAQQVKAGDRNAEDSILNRETFPNVDIGSAKVDVSKVIIEGLSEKILILVK